MFKPTRCLTAIVASLLPIWGSKAMASGFALIENSGAGTGNAYAGASAAALDPSTAFFNPAAMTEIEGRKFTAVAHVVGVTTKYSDKGTTSNPAVGGAPIDGVGYDDSVYALVPNLFYIAPLNDDLTLGFALNVPFGLETDYSDDWVGRYGAINSKVSSLNLNPSLAWRLSDKLSLGAGLSAQYFHAELSNAIDSGTICLGLAQNNEGRAQCIAAGLTPANVDRDGFVEVSGDSWAVTFNAGLLYKFTENTRIGLSFRSAVDQDLEGEADFEMDETLATLIAATGSTAFTDGDVTAEANLPATVSLSGFHQLNDKIQLLADMTWTQWSRFEELRIKFDNPDQADSFTTENWEDVMRYSIGLNYLHSDRWTFRTGLAYDEEPIPSVKYRTPRIPGNDRVWLSIGTGYRIDNDLSIDIGVAHLMVDDTPIDHTDEGIGHTIRGIYQSHANVFSAQLNWHFD